MHIIYLIPKKNFFPKKIGGGNSPPPPPAAYGLTYQINLKAWNPACMHDLLHCQATSSMLQILKDNVCVIIVTFFFLVNWSIKCLGAVFKINAAYICVCVRVCVCVLFLVLFCFDLHL